MKQGQVRNFGLDLCRSIAILSVICGHMLGHSLPHPELANLSFIGMFGVDLFFCLSGFLIGRILIKSSQSWHLTPQSGLFKFWYRRWMRTLPLYFFFLIIWLKWDWQGASTLSEQLPYLFFSQNLAWPMTDFYLLTWSLAVEEWFYYLFPLLLLGVIGFGGNNRQGITIAIIVFIIAPFFARIFFADQIVGLTNFDEGIRHIVIFRLDAIGFGVIMACLFCWYPRIFHYIAKYWHLPLILTIGCIAMPKLGYPYIAQSPLLMSTYLSLSALAFAGLIPFFNNIQWKHIRWFTTFIQFTSKISYSMYLGHIIAFIAVINTLQWFNIFDIIYPNPWVTYPLFFIAIYVFAALTYYLIEQPALRLRDARKKGSSEIKTHE